MAADDGATAPRVAPEADEYNFLSYQDEDAVLKALRTNTAYLQREVAHRVKMKYAARLKFLADESFDEGSHIDALLRDPKVARDLDGDD